MTRNRFCRCSKRCFRTLTSNEAAWSGGQLLLRLLRSTFSQLRIPRRWQRKFVEVERRFRRPQRNCGKLATQRHPEADWGTVKRSLDKATQDRAVHQQKQEARAKWETENVGAPRGKEAVIDRAANVAAHRELEMMRVVSRQIRRLLRRA